MTVLIDTGIFFGFYNKRDVHHFHSIVLLIHAIQGRFGRPYITEHILDETLTLLKYKVSNDAARSFIEYFIKSGNLKIIFTDEVIIARAVKLFLENSKLKGFSFTDSVSIITVRELGIDYLMTYDKILKKFVKIISNEYVESLPKDELKKITEIINKKI